VAAARAKKATLEVGHAYNMNRDLIAADWVQSTRHARHLGFKQKAQGIGSGRGDPNGEPREAGVTEAGKPSRLSMMMILQRAQGNKSQQR
jgi:hypothetical protein